MTQVILGSSSAFRKAQLETLGIEFECFSPDIDEDSIKESGLTPKEISIELSKQKGLEVQKHFPDAIIIAGDQVLNFNGAVFNKPLTEEKAIENLMKLKGHTHELITSIAILKGVEIKEFTVVAKMKMRDLSLEQITYYVKKDQPLWSSGAYKLETMGIALFDKIECNDHSSIIGLPLMSVSKALMDLGVPIFGQN